jgi:hypothetical protein
MNEITWLDMERAGVDTNRVHIQKVQYTTDQQQWCMYSSEGDFMLVFGAYHDAEVGGWDSMVYQCYEERCEPMGAPEYYKTSDAMLADVVRWQQTM